MRPEIFIRYASRNVPRYTSYPTAPSFSPVVGEADYRGWLQAIPDGAAISLYIHIPFCRSMCLYCGCHTTVTARQEPIARYLASLCREIELVSRAASGSLRIRHLHFGGGSPTLMQPGEMWVLMNLLKRHFAIAGDAEIAIEVDPRTLSPAMAEALGQSGFTRASIGVQCFDAEVQRAIRRVQSFEETEAAVSALRQAGIGGINLDLLYGLPHQSVDSCLDTLDKALLLAPDRLAIFGYAHVPSFKRHQRRIDETALPRMPARLDQSRTLSNGLLAAGYVRIGLDHFARPHDPLAAAFKAGTLRRNFQGYTTDTAQILLGLGASSIGRLPSGYVQNEVPIRNYLCQLADGRLPVARGCRIEPEDRVRGAIIERIMCDHRVDLEAVCASFDAEPDQVIDGSRLEVLERDGLIDRCGSIIEICEEARPLVRSVAAAFDAYLMKCEAQHTRAV